MVMAMDFFMFNNKTILITGGTGTWGREFTWQLLKHADPKEIRIYSRNEYQQTKARRLFAKETARLKFIIGDVRDKDRLNTATKGVDFIIHLAALKHVPIVEENPWEAVQTNIVGTQNVIEVATTNNIEKVLYVSSDKAVDPLNLYGMTKLVGERLIINANDISGVKTRFICYRAGNVMGSQGSVVPIFQEQILREGAVTVTDPSMTRFFMSVGDIVRQALIAMTEGVGGEIFIPTMKATKLSDIVDVMIKNLGDGKTEVKKIDVRPGEKQAELLITRQEAPRTKMYKELYVILPYFPSEALTKKYGHLKTTLHDEFGSHNAELFSHDELKNLIKKEGFLETLPLMHADALHFKKGKYLYF